MQIGMAGRIVVSRKLETLGFGIFIGFVLWILLVSLVALASSAYARLKAVAGGLVLGFFFILSGASVMINGVFRSTWGHAVNPSWATRRLWYAMLNVNPPSGPGVIACIAVILVMMLLLILGARAQAAPGGGGLVTAPTVIFDEVSKFYGEVLGRQPRYAANPARESQAW